MIRKKLPNLLSELPRSACNAFGETSAFQSVVSPADAVLVAWLSCGAWQPIVALFVGPANRVSESGVDLRNLGAFWSVAEKPKQRLDELVVGRDRRVERESNRERRQSEPRFWRA